MDTCPLCSPGGKALVPHPPPPPPRHSSPEIRHLCGSCRHKKQNRPEARVHTEGTTREMETNMKVREAQLSKDTPSRDAISGGNVVPTSPPPRRCDTFDMTCRVAVMVGRGGVRGAGGGTRGFAVNVKGMGPYLLLPWRCSSGRRGSGVERNPSSQTVSAGAPRQRESSRQITAARRGLGRTRPDRMSVPQRADRVSSFGREGRK